MDHFQAWEVPHQPRRCRHHGHVDCVRALGAAKDQHPRELRTSNFEVRSLKELSPNRIACNKAPPSEERERLRIGHCRRPDKRREQPIGQAGDGVLFQHQCGNAANRGGKHDRPRAVTAHANHRVGAPPAEQAPGVEEAGRQEECASQPRHDRFAFDTGCPNHIQLETLARHDTRLEAARRSRE